MNQADGDHDRWRALIDSLSGLASAMESDISELEGYRLESADADRALLGNIVPLQARLQRMQCRLLQFGHGLTTPPNTSPRDLSVPSRFASSSLPHETRIARNQAYDQQCPSQCRRVAILTFGRWTRQATEVLYGEGLVEGRGEFGCFYLVHLSQVQKRYLERIRRLCFYHVICDAHYAFDVAALIRRLPRAERGRLQRQEVLDLPATKDEEVQEEQIGAWSPSSSSTAGARRSSQASAASVPGSLLRFGRLGNVSVRQGGGPDQESSADGAAGQFAPTTVDGAVYNRFGGSPWIPLGFASF